MGESGASQMISAPLRFADSAAAAFAQLAISPIVSDDERSRCFFFYRSSRPISGLMILLLLGASARRRCSIGGRWLRLNCFAAERHQPVDAFCRDAAGEAASLLARLPRALC